MCMVRMLCVSVCLEPVLIYHYSHISNLASNTTYTHYYSFFLFGVYSNTIILGYLTNTGIKFMILVENIYLNQDGSRFRQGQDHAPPSSSLPNNSNSREADLKKMFVSV